MHRKILVLLCFCSALPVFAWEPAREDKKPARATVILCGKQTNEVIKVDSGVGAAETFVGIEIVPGKVLYVRTHDPVTVPQTEKVTKLTQLINEELEASKRAIAELKGDDRTKKIKAIREEYAGKKKRLMEDSDWVIVKGSLVRVGKLELKGPAFNFSMGDKQTLQLAGTITKLDATPKESAPTKGSVIVEGEILKDKIKLGKDEVAPLAIQNEGCPIAVVGKATDGYTPEPGMLRVTGRIRTNETGVVVLDAVKLETIKK